MSIRLSIIIPVYNEEKTIGPCINRAIKAKLPKNCKKEIIVVNDGSWDKTGRQIDKFKNIIAINYKKNRGKGYAIRKGLEKASGNYILIQDGDLEYDPQDYPKLLKPILFNKAVVVYGSRFIGEHRNLYFWHMMANKFLSLMTNILYDSTLSDMEVGYKVFPKKLLKSLNLKESCFGFEAEVTAKILKRKIRIYEVPISYAGREFNEGKKITWFDGVKALFFLFKYKFFN